MPVHLSLIRSRVCLAGIVLVCLFSDAAAHITASPASRETLRPLRGGGWEKNESGWVWRDEPGSKSVVSGQTGDSHGKARRKRKSRQNEEGPRPQAKVSRIEQPPGVLAPGRGSEPAGLPITTPTAPAPPIPPRTTPRSTGWVPQLDELDLPELPPNPPPLAPILKEKLAMKLSDLQQLQGSAVPSDKPPDGKDAAPNEFMTNATASEEQQQSSVATLDAEIVEILKKLSEQGELDQETWAELRRGGVKRKHLREAGVVASAALLVSLSSPHEPPMRVAVKHAENGAATDLLGRLPAWTGGGEDQRLALVDTNPLSKALVQVEGGGQQAVSVYNPLYGREDVSFAVAIPEERLSAAQNRTKCVLTAGGVIYRDTNLETWPQHDFRLFIGDLGQHVTDKQLTEALRGWRGFNMARVVTDKRSRLCKGFGFASFASEAEGVAVLRHQRSPAQDKICIGDRPITIKKGKWERKVLRAEAMPEVARLREQRLLAMAQGRISPHDAPLRNKAYKRALLKQATQHVWTPRP